MKNFDYPFREGAEIVALDGKRIGTVDHFAGEGDDTRIVVQLPDGDRTLMVPYTVVDFERSTEDRVYLTGEVGNLLDAPMAETDIDHGVIEVKAETAEAFVHEVDRGRVLVEKAVELVPHRADVEVGEDRVDIERVPVDEVMDARPETRQEGDTMVIPVVEEVLVVVKRYRVIEEVRVTKYRDVRTETFEEELKREFVRVTETDADGSEIKR